VSVSLTDPPTRCSESAGVASTFTAQSSPKLTKTGDFGTLSGHI
jgi:hypothetical protein